MDCTSKRCNNRPAPGKRCDACRALWRRYSAVKRRAARKRGVCPYDGRERVPGMQSCQVCIDRSNRISAQRRAQNIATHQCQGCHATVETNPRTGQPFTKCPDCRLKYKDTYLTAKPEAAE